MGDFCALLGMRPAAKYETTWERIARAVRDHVPGSRQYETFHGLAAILLLTYALHNADCHTKNIALLYNSRADAHLSPAHDFLTTNVYAGYQHNPPGISFLGKKTWTPGSYLVNFIAAIFGVSAKEQKKLLESIGDSVLQTAPLVRQKMKAHPAFRDIGKRMLRSWEEGVTGLRGGRVYAVGDWSAGTTFAEISDSEKLWRPRKVIGRSPLLAARSQRRKTLRKKAPKL